MLSVIGTILLWIFVYIPLTLLVLLLIAKVTGFFEGIRVNIPLLCGLTVAFTIICIILSKIL